VELQPIRLEHCPDHDSEAGSNSFGSGDDVIVCRSFVDALRTL